MCYESDQDLPDEPVCSSCGVGGCDCYRPRNPRTTVRAEECLTEFCRTKTTSDSGYCRECEYASDM